MFTCLLPLFRLYIRSFCVICRKSNSVSNEGRSLDIGTRGSDWDATTTGCHITGPKFVDEKVVYFSKNSTWKYRFSARSMGPLWADKILASWSIFLRGPIKLRYFESSVKVRHFLPSKAMNS